MTNPNPNPNDDLTPFFSPELAVLASFKGAEFLAHYSNQGGEDLGIEIHDLSILCLSDSVASAKHGDFIYIKDSPLEIIGILPINDGKIVKIMLRQTQ